jgi:RNA polymerase sigma factor (sigma-70 family)
MHESDETVMLAVRGGDTHRLAVLFERYHARLFDFFCRLNGNPAASEDLVQEAFFRILKYRDTYQEGHRFRTWMYQIARNVRLQHHRKNPAVEPVQDNRSLLPPDRLQNDDEARLLQCALLKLPEETRELLVLAWLQEMPYAEIADLLGVQVGVVKVRVHRGLKRLRELYLNISKTDNVCNVKKFRVGSQIS